MNLRFAVGEGTGVSDLQPVNAAPASGNPTAYVPPEEDEDDVDLSTVFFAVCDVAGAVESLHAASVPASASMPKREDFMTREPGEDFTRGNRISAQMAGVLHVTSGHIAGTCHEPSGVVCYW